MSTLRQKIRARLSAMREHANDLHEAARPGRVAATLLVVGVLALVAVGIWIVWTVPQLEVNRYPDPNHELTIAKKLELEDAFRKTITQIVLSVFGLLILYFTWRRARAGDASVRIMEQGHITDRFTKAIEQLGKLDGDKPNIEVRLGAIYALERIAFDSPRDHWTIMEILTAYIRQNSPLDPQREHSEGEKPRTDIQAILTVLRGRKISPTREQKGQILDLAKTRLCGADLSKTDLRSANLQMTDLRGASLWKARLHGAHMWGANLQGASLKEAVLCEAKDLTIEQVHSARNWELAHYSPALSAELELSPPCRDSLDSKSLSAKRPLQ